ncbi:MAG: acetate--CoA ligase family protein [Candidatus Eisenbacteria bacterium]
MTRAIAVEPAPATPASRIDSLQALIRPGSVAVIGASRDAGTVGGAIFHNLLAHGFTGPVYPVNPKAPVVQSVAAYPTIETVPGPVDLAVIVVPAAHVPAVMEACGRKGVRAVVVISAGFKETGEAGAALQQRVLEIARAHGMRMLGPNCLGILNTEAGVRLDATFAPTYPPAGSVAFSSQSGALGLAILEYAATLNIGISHFVSVGNKADVSGNDLLEFWEQDAGTRIILLYLESFGNPRRFTQIARRVARTKPIVAVKSGRTRAGQRAASSHTGSIAGADAAVEALCRQSGVIRTNTMEELFDVAMLLANQPVPAGSRVGIVTNAGGPGIMASDACETHGLEVPILTDETVATLRSFLPAEASTRNPVDMIASATPASFEKGVAAVLGDPKVDALLVLYVPPIVTTPTEVAEAIVRGVAAATGRADAAGRPHKPVLSCFMGSHGVPEGLRTLHEGNIPSYAFPESAAIALSHAVRYGHWRSADEGKPVEQEVDRERAARVVARAAARPGDGWLAPDEVAEVLEAYRIPQPAGRLARTVDEAVAAAAALGYPVVLKLDSETLTHKSDVGGVVLDLRGAAEVRAAWQKIRDRLTALGKAGEMRGALIQPLVREGTEIIIGMSRDPSFGPIIMFGLGGVHVELLRDVGFRVAPLTDRDARELVRGVRGYRLLEGYRGASPADIAALELALLRVAQMAEAHPEMEEMDLNPVRVLPPGRGLMALDARIRVKPGRG